VRAYRFTNCTAEQRIGANSRGLYALNSFTWSRARDNLEANNGDNSRINYGDLESEFGLSSYDQPLNNTTTVVWELPVGRDRRWGNSLNPVLDAVIGGWRVTAINTMTSGRTVNLSFSPASQFQVDSVTTHRPNISGDIYSADRSHTNYFNRNNVTIPTDGPFGNAPRNVARGPATFTLDMGLHKTFSLPAAARLEFRVETFNVFNRTNFDTPNGNRSSTAFGTITGLLTPPRQIQLGVKVNF
jgi:hypothetical protein